MSKTIKIIITIFSILIAIIILFLILVLWTVKKEQPDTVDRLAICKSLCLSGDISDKKLECQVDDMVLTLDQFCGIYRYNNNKEVSVTANDENNVPGESSNVKVNSSVVIDATVFRGFESKGLLINFEDGYEMPPSSDDPERIKALKDMIMFGPQRTIEDQIGQEISARPYQLQVIPFRDVKEIMTAANAEGPRNEDPVVININDLTGVEYATIGICDGREVEIVGVSYNYHFSYDNCGSINNISKRDYLIDVIKTAKLIE